MATRNRLNVIKQCVLRNDHFSPSTLPSKDRENLLTVSKPWFAWLFAQFLRSCTAKIDKATVGSRRGPILAVWHAHPLKGGETLPRGPGWFRRARLLAAGKPTSHSCPHSLTILHRTNQARVSSPRDASLSWRATILRRPRYL